MSSDLKGRNTAAKTVQGSEVAIRVDGNDVRVDNA